MGTELHFKFIFYIFSWTKKAHNFNSESPTIQSLKPISKISKPSNFRKIPQNSKEPFCSLSPLSRSIPFPANHSLLLLHLSSLSTLTHTNGFYFCTASVFSSEGNFNSLVSGHGCFYICATAKLNGGGGCCCCFFFLSHFHLIFFFLSCR